METSVFDIGVSDGSQATARLCHRSRDRNVTRASSLLNLVQPAVSRQLRMLEEDMGTELFDRSRHGMMLTPSGKTMLEYARRILNEVARAKAEIQPTEGPVSGIVSIGLLASTSDLLGHAADWRSGATISAHPLAADYWLRRTFAGLARSRGPGCRPALRTKETPALHVKALLEENLWVVANASARLSRKRPLALSRVAREPFVLPAAPQGLRALIEHAATKAGVTLQIFAETNALSVQKELVVQGHGWTILPAVCVTKEVEQGLLCAAPLAPPGLQRTVVLAAPSSRQATAPVRCVVAALLDCVKSTFEQGCWPDARWLG